MATDLVAFKGQQVASAFQGVIDPSESLSDGIGGGFGVIGYKGKDWTLQYRGKSYAIPDKHLDVIMIRQAKHREKTYFPKYEEGSHDRPACASINGITPDEGVPDPQDTSCALCKHNKVKQNAQGFRTKACKDYKRIAVLLLPDASAAWLGEPLVQPVLLRVPPASLTALGNYGDYLNKCGNPYIGVITRITFEPKAYPQMLFYGKALLSNDEAPVVLSFRDDPLTLRILGEGPPTVRPVEQEDRPLIKELPTASLGLVAALAAKREDNVIELPKKLAPPSSEDDNVEEADEDLQKRLDGLIKF